MLLPVGALLLAVAQAVCDEPRCLCTADPHFGQCNLADGEKIPPVVGGVETMPRGPSIESGIKDPRGFEHALGHALRSTDAVQHATREFGVRLYRAFVEPHKIGPERTREVSNAFGQPSGFDQTNTGWVGPDPGVIETVLRTGNIREVWALVYALTKTAYLDRTVAPPDGTGALMKDVDLLSRGLSPKPLRERAKLINATAAAMAASSAFDMTMKFAQGVPDFAFPGFDSWVRFDFTATELDGNGNPAHLWNAARIWRNSPNRTTLMSNDTSIDPPLSKAELAYQCSETAPPCRLHWVSGLNGFTLSKTAFSANGASKRLPGYIERANSLGYRTVAGPSGTTQNVLQYGMYLGMGMRPNGAEDDWMPLLRLTMLAWMLPTDDHSLYEIMLGAEPYMGAGASGFHMTQNLEDLVRLCPPTRTLTVTTRQVGGAGAGPTGGSLVSFPCEDIWAAVGNYISRDSDFVQGWTREQEAFWTQLLAAHPTPPSPLPHMPGGAGKDDGSAGVVSVVVVLVMITAAGAGLLWRRKRRAANENSGASLLG